jgi:cell division protein FtsB
MVPFKKNNKPVDIKIILINTFIFLLIAYFSYHSLSGARGLLAYFKFKKEIMVQTQVLTTLQAESGMLEQKIKMLHPDRINIDFIDELARKDLGMIGKDELLINVKD